jgi:glutamyl-tRNA reductase
MSLVSGCSIEHHLSKAQKHIDIAKRKGAVIRPDTIWHYTYKLDTVWNETNNTFETRHTVKDSFPYTVTNTIYSGMTRQERKHFEDMFKHMEKMMKLQNDSLKLALKYQTKQHKQDEKTERTVVRQENRKSPWVWVILAGLLVIAIYLIKQK